MTEIMLRVEEQNKLEKEEVGLSLVKISISLCLAGGIHSCPHPSHILNQEHEHPTADQRYQAARSATGNQGPQNVIQSSQAVQYMLLYCSGSYNAFQLSPVWLVLHLPTSVKFFIYSVGCSWPVCCKIIPISDCGTKMSRLSSVGSIPIADRLAVFVSSRTANDPFPTESKRLMEVRTRAWEGGAEEREEAPPRQEGVTAVAPPPYPAPPSPSPCPAPSSVPRIQLGHPLKALLHLLSTRFRTLCFTDDRISGPGYSGDNLACPA